MKRHHDIVGLKTLTKSGSLVFCERCKKIIASINSNGYNYIKLVLNCTCGNHGSLEFSYTKTLPDFSKTRVMPYEKDGLAVCKVCGNKIFGVIPDRTSNYSFSCVCSCGEKYNIPSTFKNRLGETMKQFEIKYKTGCCN